MKIAIIGQRPAFNAEHYFGRGFQKLNHEVVYFNQYVGIAQEFFTRFVMTRSSILRPFINSLPINKTLVHELRAVSPDIVLVIKGELVSTNVLRSISNEFGIYLHYPDNFHFLRILRNRLSMFQAVFVGGFNTSTYLRLGARRVYTIPWACDPEIHKPIQSVKKYRISFVGAPYLRRYRILRQLEDVDIFGPKWLLHPGRMHQAVYGPDFAQVISQSTINLDIHHKTNFLADDIGMRAFEIGACGGFLLSDKVPSLLRLLPGSATYDSAEDISRKADWYLSNRSEREELAEHLMEICLSEHTYVKRCETMLKLMG